MKAEKKVELNELARLVNGKVVGDGSTIISGVAGIKDAKEGDITFLAQLKYAPDVKNSKASAIVLGKPLEESSLPTIIVENPMFAFSKLISHFYVKPYSPKGVSPKAVIGNDTDLGKDLSIYPSVTVGDNAKIGDRVTLYPGVFVGEGSEIGDDSVIYPNVSIMEKVFIGKRVIIHSGTVIGSDGYGYVPVAGKHHKIPQVGSVVIEEDVEIGSNVSIDRATLGQTIIKRGTKIDNLVQIAHNVTVGEDCLIVGQVGISGSTELGNNVILAGQVGVADHVKIGDNTLVGAGTGVWKDVEANQRIFGNPFMTYGKFLRTQALIMRLPEIKEQIKAQEERLNNLENQVEK